MAIKRVRTHCGTCGHNNTLRITLGTENRQEHTFACAGCNVASRIAVDVDFENLVPLAIPEDTPEDIRPLFFQPSATFHFVENCIESNQEGTITNLDPNFLVPEDLLHKDGVFSWMLESRRIGMLDDVEQLPKPHVNDIIHGVGGVRQVKALIAALVKAADLHRTGRLDLRDKVISEFATWAGIPETLTLNRLCLLSASVLVGRNGKPAVERLISEARECRSMNPEEYYKLRTWFLNDFDDVRARQVGMLEEFAKAYDQLSQTLIYAMRNTAVDAKAVASSRDFRSVRMFYGNCFEELASGLSLPACLNNVRNGRAFDAFERMTLKKYITIDKAGRANPFKDNASLACLHEEFDSRIRNSSHHGAMRVQANRPDLIEYRPGNSGDWKRMPYAEYLWRCNRIMICSMRLLILQLFVSENGT